MKIRKIELFNFGSYEGLTSFDLITEDPAKRIIIIGGKNGAGKTTLFTAMQVCLYGYLAFGYKNAGKIYHQEIFKLVNSRARVNEDNSAYVRIVFDEMNQSIQERFSIKRNWGWADGLVSETLEILKGDDVMDDEQLSNFQKYLIHLIPPDLLNLYFFDGEKIADYFLNEKENRICDALMVLSGNDTFSILYDSIRKLMGKGDVGQSAALKYAESRDRQKNLFEVVAEKRDEISKLKQEIDSMNADLEQLAKDYESHGGVSVERWQELQSTLKQEEEKRESLNYERKIMATEILPFLIVEEILLKVKEQIENEKDLAAYKALQHVLLQDGFNKVLIEAVEETGSSKPGQDSYVIGKHIRNYFYNENIEKIQKLLGLSDDEANQCLAIISKIEIYDRRRLSQNRVDLNNSLNESKLIRETMQKSSVDSFQDYLIERARITDSIRTLNSDFDQRQAQLEILYEETEQNKKELETIRKIVEQELKQKSVHDLSGKALLLIEELQGQLFKRVIKQVEEDVNNKFKQLIRKEDFFDYISIDDSFNIQIIRNQPIEIRSLLNTARRSGVASIKKSIKERAFTELLKHYHAREDQLISRLNETFDKQITLPIEIDKGRFSNGEKQIFVMALYWAIMNQSHNDIPFIIDTPFARIDTEHRSRITEKFFAQLKGQMFVLSTNEELNKEHLNSLSDQVAKVYMLEYGQDKSTRVYEDCFFEV